MTISQQVGSSIGGIGYARPPIPAPKPPSTPRIPGGGFLGVLGASAVINEVIGRLGGYKFVDDQLAKIKSGDYAPYLTLGEKTITSPPPFTGGQSAGILYNIRLQGTVVTRAIHEPNGRSIEVEAGFPAGTPYGFSFLPGKISSIRSYVDTSAGNSPVIECFSNNGLRRDELRFGGFAYPNARINISSISVVRSDGQNDTGGSLPSTQIGTEPLDNANKERRRQAANPIITPNFSPAVGWRNSGNVNTAAVRGALGLGAESLRPPSPLKTGDPNLDDPKKRRGIPGPATTPPSPNVTPKTPTTPNKDKDGDRKIGAPVPPFSNGDFSQNLAQIGALLGTISANTSPEAQRLNSKNGSCDALQSPSCTKGVEDRIKNPLDAKLDAAQVARDANAAAQSAALGGIAANQVAQNGVLAAISAKATSIFDFLNRVWQNQAVDKVMQYITMITVLHNASMLSRSIGETLGSVFDQGLQIFGLQLKDKEGNQLGVTQFL